MENLLPRKHPLLDGVNLGNLFACLLILLSVQRVMGIESIVQSATGTVFPSQVEISSGLKTRILDATGVASRKVLFFKIYSIINYLETMGKNTKELVSAVENNSLTKQLTINFERTINAEKIRKHFRESYTTRASSQDITTTKSSLQSFLAVIRSGVKDGDRFTVRCLPGGHIKVFFKNKKIIEMRDPLSAKIFWSIWFGDKSVVDRKKLLARIAGNDVGEK